MKKIFFVFAILLSGFSFAQEVRWGATANVHSSSIEGIHDFSRGRIAPSVGLFMEIPLETFQRSIYAPLRYYIYPVVEFSMEGEKKPFWSKADSITEMILLLLHCMGNFTCTEDILRIFIS